MKNLSISHTAPVAQVSNLLYRRLPACRRRLVPSPLEGSDSLPIGNRRNSRLETCATGAVSICALIALSLTSQLQASDSTIPDRPEKLSFPPLVYDRAGVSLVFAFAWTELPYLTLTAMAVLLASEEGRGMTGQVVSVDGGYKV